MAAAVVRVACALQLAAAAPSLQPSRQYSVSVDGEAAFVYLATTDGEDVHNSSFVHIPLHGAPREVVVTLLQGPAPIAAALRPDPQGKAGSLPAVKRAADGRQWTFQVSKPLRAVLEFGAVY